MWWYNILEDNKGIISHLLRLDTITAGSICLTANLVAMKRENPDPILIVKRTEWRRLIDYFGRGIEADSSRVGKKNIYFVHIVYIPRASSIKLHIPRQHLDTYFNM